MGRSGECQSNKTSKAYTSRKNMGFIRSRKMPPFFKLTLVVFCGYILWTFNHRGDTVMQLGTRTIRSAFEETSNHIKNKVPKFQNNNNYKINSYRKEPTQCKRPVTNVAFLKTHKTGSSTMSNIMLRFADTHNLTVGLPLKGHWELGGYPAYIDRRLIDPQLPKYNILGHHFRFNIDNLQQIMYDDTKYITIIRSPTDNVESVFGFFQDQSPFIEWLDESQTSIEARLNSFYDNPSKFYNTNTDWFFRAKNHMFFDTGYNVNNVDEAYIDAMVREMDNTFTFVLLTDFFDESLIMLKHIMCWDWDDIVYIKFKMRIDDAKTEVNPELAKKILKWNKADMKLYEHFNVTFWKRIEEYGLERMENDVVTFQAKQKEAEELCIDSYQPFKKKPWILGAKLVKKPSDYCKHLAWSETVYGEFLREKMYDSIESLRRPTENEEAAQNELFTNVANGALQKT